MCRGVIKIVKYTTRSLLSFKINLFSLSHSQRLCLSSIYKICYAEHLNYLIIKYNTYIQTLFTFVYFVLLISFLIALVLWPLTNTVPDNLSSMQQSIIECTCHTHTRTQTDKSTTPYYSFPNSHHRFFFLFLSL